ncbi:NUDIX hydrolase [Actinopolymorpha alba]|uniref:NUDIX hydrolase n=1 Tax=Actinopolymorpha alba TaxID=533267 RepID=UPI00037F1100|nr:hypothetical protein [Actinopolymorpha alba]
MDSPAYDATIRAVPPALAERARRLAAGEIVPPAPRHASTVVLLRDGVQGLEVYVLRRRTTMAFAAGMYAFPGGAVDARDVEDGAAEGAGSAAWAGPSPAEWADRLGFADAGIARASVCAAVRETFEESGVLLAGPSPDSVVADTTGDDWERDRMALLGRVVSFGEVLARRGLVLRSDLVAPWDHWVTPRVEERRFDTRFFLAALPAGQHTRDVAGEADRVAWMRPSEALASVERGEMRMLPPTYLTLASLADFPDVKTALTAAAGRSISPIMPTVTFDGEQARWALPGDAGGEDAYDEGIVR